MRRSNGNFNIPPPPPPWANLGHLTIFCSRGWGIWPLPVWGGENWTLSIKFQTIQFFSGAEVVNYGGPWGTCHFVISFPASNLETLLEGFSHPVSLKLRGQLSLIPKTSNRASIYELEVSRSESRNLEFRNSKFRNFTLANSKFWV